MKKCRKISLALMLCASFLMTGCDAQQILTTIENIAKGVQEAMPAIQQVVDTFQNIFNNDANADTDQTATDNTQADTDTENQANVNITDPNDENIDGQNNTGTNTNANANTNNTTGNTNTATTDNTSASQAEAALRNYEGGKLSPSEFATLFGPVAREASKKSGVPASIIMAQAALETGWGSSTIGNAKNLFGIKGTGPAGSITVPTREYINGRMQTVQGKFRKYNNWQESIEDHTRLLTGSSRYAKCMTVKNDPDQFARELQKAGYATDPQYASKLISIMKSNNFYQYDN